MTRSPIKPPVSRTPRGIRWLKQFKPVDQQVAAEFADALLLLNETDVADAVRDGIEELAKTTRLRRRVIAVYPEREFDKNPIFKADKIAGRDGIIRMRAFGSNGPAPLAPLGDSPRVGSEGWMATIVSQSVGARKKMLANRPGPDRIRSRQADMILIATDFIGSGKRVCDMLDKFMEVASVRAWRSNDWIEFAVVAAAGTATGITTVEAHRTRPTVKVITPAPTLATYRDQAKAEAWRYLIHNYGPSYDRGGGRFGFQDGGALIAFNYRAPNNTPLIFHSHRGGWTPLLPGPASSDVRAAFGLAPLPDRLAASGNALAPESDLLTGETKLKRILESVQGQWRDTLVVGFAERTNLTVPEVLDTVAEARKIGLLDHKGRLTDLGHTFLGDAERLVKRDKTVPTRELPYYPRSLRVPR